MKTTLFALTEVVGDLLCTKRALDRQADFSKYKTYRWVPAEQGKIQNQLLEKNVMQGIDEQFAAKGLHRVDSNPDLLVAYQAGIQKEQQLNSTSTGDGVIALAGVPAGAAAWGAPRSPPAPLRLEP